MKTLTLKLQPHLQQKMKGILAFMTFVMMLTIPTIAFGNDSVSLSPVQPITNTETKPTVGITNPNDKFYETGELPSVQVEEAANFISGKLGDLIQGLQLIIKPFCVLMAALCIGMSVFGIFGDSALLSRGLFGLFLTAICYFGVMYAPEIVEFIHSWMAEGTEFLG